MNDENDYRKAHSGSRVSLESPWEIDYWTSELNCTEAQLRQAVATVGTKVEAVAEYLGGLISPSGER